MGGCLEALSTMMSSPAPIISLNVDHVRCCVDDTDSSSQSVKTANTDCSIMEKDHTPIDPPFRRRLQSPLKVDTSYFYEERPTYRPYSL